mgnify:CR=1 FL=1
MKKGEIINGYTILEDFKVAGGQSKISFAEKEGVTYFIKEFLEPKYPNEDSPGSPEVKLLRRLRCEVFEKHHKEVNERISAKCSIGGNLVFAVDFFRNKTTYYKINEKIDISSLSVNEIAKLPIEKRILIMKTVSHSLNILHKIEIVHGDIKPDNILIKRKEKSGNYVAKLIDFDNSYFSERPPCKVEEIIGDQKYYSPELANYIINESDNQKDLTVKSDVFALGVLFSEYLVGEFPVFNKEKYEYPWQSVLNGNNIYLKEDGLSKEVCDLINSMYALRKEDRPSVSEVFSSLKGLGKGKPSPDSIDVKLGEDVMPVRTKLSIGKGFKKSEDAKDGGGAEKTVLKSKLRGTLLGKK